MSINISFVKRLYKVIAVCIIMATAIMTGCEKSDDSGVVKETKPTGDVVSPTPKAKIKKKTIQQIENAIEEDAEKLLKEKAERIRDSVQELYKSEDGNYYYGYTEGNIKISIDTKGFDDGNHGKYQLLETYQEDGQVYIAMLHRTEDEKIYGEVYKYIG